MNISSKVPCNYNSHTILEYLAKRFTYLSKDEWLVRIGEGRLQLNQIIVIKPEIICKTDDLITYDMPSFKEPPADLNYSIVYEDEWILGINKPGNLLVHHKGRSFKSNLIYQLRNVHKPVYPDSGIVNRLDRETSGIVLVSKKKEYLSELHKLFSTKSIEKNYYAIVHGYPSLSSGVISFPIGKKTGSEIKYRFCINGENAKDSVTNYKIIKPIGKNYTLVELIPKTGRTHQLRVHMDALGHTILGDKLYSMNDEQFIKWRNNPDNYKDTLKFPRQALHCFALNFIHPFDKKECRIEASIPDDMKSFIAQNS